MDNPFAGKSIFIWNIPSILGGDPEKIARWLVDHGFVSVMVKACDGPYVFYPSWYAFPFWFWQPNINRRFVDTLRRWGIKTFIWQFNYGTDAQNEGRVAAEQAIALGADGVIVDVEGKFEKMYNQDIAVRDAGKWIGAYRKVFADYRKIPGNENYQTAPVAFCSWAEFWSPSGSQWHNVKMARFWMALPEVVAFIPMCYMDWYDERRKPIPIPSLKLEAEFARLLSQWQNIANGKPIMPAGGAYIGDGVVPTAETIGTFARMARLLCAGVTWWVLDSVMRLPDIDTTLALTPGWDTQAPDPVDPPVLDPPIAPKYTGVVKVAKINVRESRSIAAKDVGDLLRDDPITGKVTGDEITVVAGYAWLRLLTPAEYVGRYAACGTAADPRGYITITQRIDS